MKVLQQVLNQIGTASGVEVAFGGPTMNSLFQPAPPSFKTTKEPAYLFLNRTAAELHQNFWQVLWDPSLKFYALGYGH
jgi:hypothetical protein